MFILAKFMTFVTQPLAWVVLLLACGLLVGRRRQKAGQRFIAAALFVLVFMGWQVPVDAVMKRLEDSSPAPSADLNLKDYVGVVVLGGALEDSTLWETPGPGRRSQERPEPPDSCRCEYTIRCRGDGR